MLNSSLIQLLVLLIGIITISNLATNDAFRPISYLHKKALQPQPYADQASMRPSHDDAVSSSPSSSSSSHALTEFVASLSVSTPADEMYVARKCRALNLVSHALIEAWPCNLRILRAAYTEWKKVDHGTFGAAPTEDKVDTELGLLITNTPLVVDTHPEPVLPVGIYTGSTENFIYSYGTHGQLTQVTGIVVEGAGTNANAALWIRWWHWVVFNWEKPPNIEQGHVVAASLGGGNNSPHNFFPQTGLSNRDVWLQAENKASQAIKANKDARSSNPLTITKCTKITITFKYESVLHWWISSGGTYKVEYNDRTLCFVNKPTTTTPATADTNVDKWVELHQVDWTNRPASYQFNPMPFKAKWGELNTVAVTPGYQVPNGGLKLTVSPSAGSVAPTELKWDCATLSGCLPTVKTFDYTAPAQPQKLKIEFVQPTVTNLFEEPILVNDDFLSWSWKPTFIPGVEKEFTIKAAYTELTAAGLALKSGKKLLVDMVMTGGLFAKPLVADRFTYEWSTAENKQERTFSVRIPPSGTFTITMRLRGDVELTDIFTPSPPIIITIPSVTVRPTTDEHRVNHEITFNVVVAPTPHQLGALDIKIMNPSSAVVPSQTEKIVITADSITPSIFKFTPTIIGMHKLEFSGLPRMYTTPATLQFDVKA